jgi:hypothetical protein
LLIKGDLFSDTAKQAVPHTPINNKRRKLMNDQKEDLPAAEPQPPAAFAQFNIEQIRGFQCPITQEIMVDPATAADGHTYERAAIRQWFDQGHRTSPSTGLALPHRNLKPNHNLRQAIEAYRQQQAHVLAAAEQIEKQKIALASAEQVEKHQVAWQSELLEKHVVLEQCQRAAAAEQTEKQEAAAIAGEQAEKQLASQAELLARYGAAEQQTRQARNKLGRAVLNFVALMEDFLRTQPQIAWDANAAAGFVGTTVGIVLKGGAAYNEMLEKPEIYSLHPTVVQFIQTYIEHNPGLWQLREHVDFAKSLRSALYRGELEALHQRFTSEAGIVEAGAVFVARNN